MSDNRTGSEDPETGGADRSGDGSADLVYGAAGDDDDARSGRLSDDDRPGKAPDDAGSEAQQRSAVRAQSDGSDASAPTSRLTSGLSAAAARLFPGSADPSADRGQRAGSEPGDVDGRVFSREGAARGSDPALDDRTAVLSTGRQGSLPPRPAAGRPGPRPEARSGRPEPRSAKGGRRTARLAVKRVNLWSVFTTSLALATLLGIVLVVAVVVLYGVLDSIGAVSSVNDALGEVNIGELPARADVLTYALVLAAIDVVLLTVLATVFAGLYNVVSSFTGGLQVTLVDD